MELDIILIVSNRKINNHTILIYYLPIMFKSILISKIPLIKTTINLFKTFLILILIREIIIIIIINLVIFIMIEINLSLNLFTNK